MFSGEAAYSNCMVIGLTRPQAPYLTHPMRLRKLSHHRFGLSFASTRYNSGFLVWSVLLIFVVFCVVVFALFVFVLCFVNPMLPVSLDYLRPVVGEPNVASVSGLSSSCVL